MIASSVRAAALAALILALPASAQISPMAPDIAGTKYQPVLPNADYVKRVAMVPMRDGVKLYTVVVMRKGTKAGPILLTRTPYNAAGATARSASQNITEILPISDTEFVNDGYIRVYQDVRGKYGSEGDYVMNRPLRGPLNATAVDHATDAYDTIDWLVKNVPETNGRVAITGSSYPGFTALMALIDPHPALKASVPMSPMVDGWRGDDWFHNGAFRQMGFDYFIGQTSEKGAGGTVASGAVDDYADFLSKGSAGDYAKAYGFDAMPVVQKMFQHPVYDGYWQGQALDLLLAKRTLTVPTMLVVGQWDQEDSWGTPAVYRALEKQVAGKELLSMVIGPWRHSGVNYDGSSLGALKFAGDTGLQFRRDTMKPFLDRYLKEGAPAVQTPPVLTYATGTDKWEATPALQTQMTPIYLQEGFGLGFAKPAGGRGAADSYVSDPMKPVPFVARPVDFKNGDQWRTWLVADQRFVDGRPDVLSYTGEVLTKAVHIRGAPEVELHAATTGTDSDWVVKLIDVAPPENFIDPKLAGYQLGVGIEIFRGRYRDSLENPSAILAGKVQTYSFKLPTVNHVFKPGHRIMVQIQSTLFPLYDRNPQTFVKNIFYAKPGDYRKATQTIHRGGAQASAVLLPIVAE